MNWQEISGNWVYIPRQPIGIIHFLGGAFVAAAPQLTYRLLLEHLGKQGYAIITTPFINTFDHRTIAKEVHQNFDRTLAQLQAKNSLPRRYLPIYGIGHSMGCKLHLLIGSLFPVDRAGNILISYNNFAARDAIPLVQQFNFNPTFNLNLEFTPSPTETNQIIGTAYQIRRNLLIKFTNDNLDQTLGLTELLKRRFPGMITDLTLSGSHLTPLGQDVTWKPGQSFTPLDALGQWLKQEVYREHNQLKSTLCQWLNPSLS